MFSFFILFFSLVFLLIFLLLFISFVCVRFSNVGFSNVGKSDLGVNSLYIQYSTFFNCPFASLSLFLNNRPTSSNSNKLFLIAVLPSFICVSIPDIEKSIVRTVNRLRKKFNYVFTTGGIGPTHDDITSRSIAKAFRQSYGYHKEAYKILENYYGNQI